MATELTSRQKVKLLEVLKKLNEDHPMDIVSTFMPAHVVLADWKGREDEFIQLCIDEMMPYVKEHNLAEFVDIFTEDSVFDVEQSRKYLQAAKDMGFGLKFTQTKSKQSEAVFSQGRCTRHRQNI